MTCMLIKALTKTDSPLIFLHLQIALISKSFEPQEWDWSQMIDLLKLFPNLTNFSFLALLKVHLLLFKGERRLFAWVV